ncbi:MAG: hypothetical protein M3Y30_12165 [Gemmatimonadota bacterium]|nr:hypothetical protein [Gemmatimonadota bacterium]
MFPSLALHAFASLALACAAGAAPPRTVVGTWAYREQQRGGVYDEARRRWGLPFAEQASYTFLADGRYEYHRSRTSSTGTGNLELSWSTTGAYALRGTLLTLTPLHTVFASHSDIPDTPTGNEVEPAGASVTVSVEFHADSAACALELPVDRGAVRLFELRETASLIPR